MPGLGHRSALACLASALACLVIPSLAHAKGRVHVVAAGETLWTIARQYGCPVSKLSELNRLDNNLIHPGQELELPPCDGVAVPPPSPTMTSAAPRSAAKLDASTSPAALLKIEHEVVAGDTLGKIAAKYGVKVEELRARNGIEDDAIFAGQKLLVTGGNKVDVANLAPIRPPSTTGQSLGSPAHGKLTAATRLPDDRSYFVRRTERRWGTSQAVHHIRAAARKVRSKFPRVHRLAVGDLSVKRGGKITLHNSHQSGRDVDLGFYYRKKPKEYPEEFVRATRKNIDIKATWLLLETLARTSTSPNGVERMFLSYETQEILYQLAVDEGIERQKLDWMFQYPNGTGAQTGLIRHWPNHEDHIHVRFACPKDDAGCR